MTGDKKFYTFPKGISVKMNGIVWMGFELANYNVNVRHVNQYATDIFPQLGKVKSNYWLVK